VFIRRYLFVFRRYLFVSWVICGLVASYLDFLTNLQLANKSHKLK